MKVIADSPPDEMYRSGAEIDCQCARCGSSVETEPCDYCEDGFDGHDCGEDTCCCLYPDENVPCDHCDGDGRWHRCLSSPEWCEANPIPGREGVKRGRIEWFTIEPAAGGAKPCQTQASVIEIRPTRNAGPRAVWEDRFGAQCSMQECKSTAGKYLWIGPDGQRMCLDQAIASGLWPLLKRFAETGTLEETEGAVADEVQGKATVSL